MRELLARATLALESRREAERIAELVLWRSRAWLIAHDDALVEDSDVERFDALVHKRAEGMPIAYLAGSREFYGREFRVNPTVLIPRPETEHLVEWALELDLTDNACVADVGTGSGCIVLTLAAERRQWRCAGTDISADALGVAAANRAQLGLENVELLQGDLLSPLAGQRLDLIVSNPPYVAAGDPHLAHGDVRFEPAIALSDGADGLALIRALVGESRGLLAPERLAAAGARLRPGGGGTRFVSSERLRKYRIKARPRRHRAGYRGTEEVLGVRCLGVRC